MIRHLESGELRALEPEHTVGRSAACSLQLKERYISAQHAAFRWSRDGWELRDLGSRNGTFLDDSRLSAGQEYPVRQGARIAFGRAQQAWELCDDAPPAAMAVPQDGGKAVLVERDLLALPTSDEPLVTIYCHDGLWVLERPDESTSPITNQQTFDVAGRTYRFCCSESVAKTSYAPPLFGLSREVQHLHLTFSVSSDEEHVHLQLMGEGAPIDMGTRGHNYLLLTLARQRLADAAAGAAEGTCGWIYQEDLLHDPSMVPPQLNIDVFRIRKQFAAAGVVDAANIVERRPRTRQLRIGTGRLTVVRV